MAGDWIKVEKSTLDKPEVRQMARLLGVKHGEALELLLRFWMWLDGNSVDGVVDGLVATDVDEMMRCPGFAMAMRGVGWLTIDKTAEGFNVPNFSRHNGETSKNRALKNERQAQWRQRSDANVDGPVDAPPSTKASTREEKRRYKVKPIVEFARKTGEHRHRFPSSKRQTLKAPPRSGRGFAVPERPHG